MELELIHIVVLICYFSTAVSFFFYSLSLKHVYRVLDKTLRGAKIKKDLNVLSNNARLNMKLSIIWPVALCLMLMARRKK